MQSEVGKQNISICECMEAVERCFARSFSPVEWKSMLK